jgi:hypothetical protein
VQLNSANDNVRRDYYVYAWLRPCGTPFYVGKGRGYRAQTHKTRNQIFTRIVNKIRTSGLEPRFVKWMQGIAEADAFSLECAYIKLFGRVNNGTGILANMTDGGEGVSGFVMGDAQRVAIAESARVRSASPEWQDRMRAANSTPEARRKNKESQISKPPKNGRRYKGVAKSGSKWSAFITSYGETRRLGTFLTEREAARAYDIAAKADSQLAWLNFPNLMDCEPPVRQFRPPSRLCLMEKPPRNISGMKGVSRSRSKWKAEIFIDGKLRYLGSFENPKDAALVYDIEARKLSPSAWLNFPANDNHNEIEATEDGERNRTLNSEPRSLNNEV